MKPGDIHDRLTRALCLETCAFRGEPSCYSRGRPWPGPDCAAPGCKALAAAAIDTMATHHDALDKYRRERSGTAGPDMAKALTAAVHALRSYQYGNASPDLARSVAETCEAALKAAGIPMPGPARPREEDNG